MIRSLRWRLQLWHALLLTGVLIIFGGVVYALQWQTRLQQTDAELDRYASVLTSRLRGLFPVPRSPAPGTWPPRNSGRGAPQRPGEASPGAENADANVADALAPANVPPRGFRDRPQRGGSRDQARDANRDGNRDANRPPAQEVSRTSTPREPRDDARPGPDRNTSDRTTAARDPSGREPGRDAGGRDNAGWDQSGQNPWFAPPPGLGLPDEFKHLFEGDKPDSFYFMIWDRNGTVLEKSKSVDDIPFPDLHTATDGLPVRTVRMRGMQREVVHVSRFDIDVLVGRSIRPDLDALHRSGLLLTMTGLGVLAIGLAGGWWFSSRAIGPIKEISSIAESISVKNLSTRINVESTATELEQLATVLNRTFDRLQSAFERQGQFTADASHELRTPLSVILSHAELALSRPRSAEDYQAAFQACRRASLRMKTLIDSLLVLARFDSGDPTVERLPIDLGQLAHEALEMLKPLAEERQVTLHCQAESLTIEADHEQMYQLLTNLLSNAIRYNRPDGRVDLEVRIDGQFALIRVVDTGVGIPAEDLPRIFDRFYRVDKARSRAEGGCGLGLAICQTIVESHRGLISATSIPNVGTTIEVRFPTGQRHKSMDVTIDSNLPQESNLVEAR
jgi:two-component system OmpR family sensor kinase